MSEVSEKLRKMNESGALKRRAATGLIPLLGKLKHDIRVGVINPRACCNCKEVFKPKVEEPWLMTCYECQEGKK